jgi:hypothetical protein
MRPLSSTSGGAGNGPRDVRRELSSSFVSTSGSSSSRVPSSSSEYGARSASSAGPRTSKRQCVTCLVAPALADYAFCADCYERRASTADFSRVADNALALMRAESQLLFPANSEVCLHFAEGNGFFLIASRAGG